MVKKKKQYLHLRGCFFFALRLYHSQEFGCFATGAQIKIQKKIPLLHNVQIFDGKDLITRSPMDSVPKSKKS